MRPAPLPTDGSSMRRTALTNYFDYGDDRLFVEHLDSNRDVRGGGGGGGNTNNGKMVKKASSQLLGNFELLQGKFGFQAASVANQKENYACWIANYQLRFHDDGTGDLYNAIWRVHTKFFKNYRNWCKFLGAEPFLASEGAPAQVLEKQVALFLCVWGEAGNLRFMPECICFLYHSLANKLEGVERLPDVDEGHYLERIVKPVYAVIATMRTATSPNPNKPLDHQDITNYDDINEFFWTPQCLDYDELNVAEALQVGDKKRFKEKRSVFNPLLAFFRVWFFLLIVFHVLIVIAYVGFYTRENDANGLAYYAHWFRSDRRDLRNHAILSVLLSVSSLFALKVVLQMWLYGLRIFNDVWLAMGVFCRLLWHTTFFGAFLLITISPLEPVMIDFWSNKPNYLAVGYQIALVYLGPVVLAGVLRMFVSKGVWYVRLLNSLDGTRRQYIGRDMAQPWRDFGLYALSWSAIYLLKFIFTLELMIKPLVGPSIELYNTVVSDSNSVVHSNHNLAFIAALWAPILFVYIYDAQIWFILYQSIVGMIMGLRQKMGSYVNVDQVKQALYDAPDQFDASVASTLAQSQRVSVANATTEEGRVESVRLRFAIIWNEIISSFRLNDLLDDRETVILQYRVLDHGRLVQNPIFLLAGKVAKAMEIATKASANKWSSAEVLKKVDAAGATDGVVDALNLTRDLFYLLLGEDEEARGALSVLEHIYNAQDFVAQLDLTQLPNVIENMIELLAVILDLPEDLSAVEGVDAESQHIRMAFHDQTRLVIDKLREVFRSVELMVSDSSISQRLMTCKFLQLSTELGFQKQQLLALYKADAMADSSVFKSDSSRNNETFFSTSSKFAREDFISSCTRLFFLLRLDIAHAQPRCEEARRRINFFLHSLTMDMPRVKSVEAMPSFSVMTPYYSETVLFTLDELKNPVSSNPLFERIDSRYAEKGRSDLTIMSYLITFHAEEWTNFLERVGVSTTEEAVAKYPIQVRLWASLRGQTLARTVYGMMMYEDALRLLRWLELWNDTSLDDAAKVHEMNRISALKFSYITGCQVYSQQAAKGDHRAADIDYLMKRFPSWRVSFMDTIPLSDGKTRYDCVLIKAEGEEIVEVYRYELPGNPILGEGKPENQNIALPFTRGEYLQTIDMNQEHYFEETLKMPNFLATAAATGEEVTIIGMKEHVFTGRASSLARFMTLQELVFVTLTQRVLARPLRSRMHYGHPDVFEKSFVMTNGGVSKASRGINLSEDVFSGYNVTLRGGLVTHVEFMQCGKGRDVTLSQINAFEAKLSNGCAESCLSREGHRMSNHLDFFRLNSMFFGHFGFYICNALTVLCVYIYTYSKLYVSTHTDVVEAAATNTAELDALAKVMSTQYILQFGLLTTLPLLATLLVEFGWKQAVFQVTELITALGVVFYVFLTGTKAHFYDVALIRGGSKYRGTGRGFAITRDPMVNFFKEYGVSHFRKAVELIGIMMLVGIYGNFEVGFGAKDEFCRTASFDCETRPDLIPKNITNLESYSQTPQSYAVASFAVMLLGACWLLAPFLFNTDGLVLEKTTIDVANWFAWMMRVKCDEELIDEAEKSTNSGTPKDGWIEWYQSDVDLMLNVGPMGRLTYMIRELRHVFAMYFVFATQFANSELWILVISVLGTWALCWVIGFVAQQSCGRNQKQVGLVARGVICMVLGLGSIAMGPIVIGKMMGWPMIKGFTLSTSIFLGLQSICQYAVALHGSFGYPIAMWSPFVTLGFLYDMLVGVFLVVPLVGLSFLPFMRILQTRMLYNGGFSRALSSGSEVAASITILVGLSSGYVYGFMSCFILTLGYVNDPKYNFISRSFLYFLTEDLKSDGSVNLLKWATDGRLKAGCALAAMLATLLTWVLGKMFGRRVNMGVGCILIASGIVLNFIDVGAMIFIAFCLIAAGCAFLVVNYLLYSFEICTKGWRGKSVSMFLLGASIGFLVNSIVQYNVNQTTINSDQANKPSNDWRMLPFYAVTPVALILIFVLWAIPESPVWFISIGDSEKGKQLLIRFRRRQNVAWELGVIENEMTETRGKRNLTFRVLFSFTLQILMALLMSNSLIKREQVQTKLKGEGDVKSSSWMVNFGITTVAGVAFSVFLIDNVRRKTILKDFLPFMALLSLFCAIVENVIGGQEGLLSALLLILFVVSGMSLMGVTWLSSLEMFGARNRALLFSLSMVIFYSTEAIIFYVSPSFAACHYMFGGLCAALTLLIFGVCASTKLGAIQLKSEKKRQQEEAAAGQGDGSRPSSQLDREEHEQQSRYAQAVQPQNIYARSHLSSSVSSGQTGIVDLNALQLTNITDDMRSPNPALQLSYLHGRQPTIESFNYSLTEEDFDGTEMHLDEILHPVPQSRSASFLYSRTFPDAQVHAETRGRGVRL